MKKEIVVLGIRGVPAKHGGFETFAEYLSLYLLKKGWSVTVYCQEAGIGKIYESNWKGVKRIHIPVKNTEVFGTIVFDLKSIWHARRGGALHLTLGYNTAIFNIIQRFYGIHNLINMDGVEWKRQKWSMIGKTWFWINERFGCWFGNHLIADHPKIEEHLATRVPENKISMIAYGGKEVTVNNVDEKVLAEFGLVKDTYGIIIARAEPENSILEAVQAFSKEQRHAKLVVLGNYDPEKNLYHRDVLESASDEVVFLGAVYDVEKVGALRFFARFYFHGHQVGGTNPSLVEALGAGNAVLAHNNPFNRWVANDAAIYFDGEDDLAKAINRLFEDNEYIEKLRVAAYTNFSDNFRWESILGQYEALFLNELLIT